MTLEHPTYISLDVAEPMASRVRGLRKWFDPECCDLPVEIAVAGSSGMGVIHPQETEVRAIECVKRLAAVTPPIETSFMRAGWMSELGVHALLVDLVPALDRLHTTAAVGLRFADDVPATYIPHCALRWTMRWMSRDQQDAWTHLLAPSDSFVLREISLYRLRPGECVVETICRFPLSAEIPPTAMR